MRSSWVQKSWRTTGKSNLAYKQQKLPKFVFRTRTTMLWLMEQSSILSATKIVPARIFQSSLLRMIVKLSSFPRTGIEYRYRSSPLFTRFFEKFAFQTMKLHTPTTQYWEHWCVVPKEPIYSHPGCFARVCLAGNQFGQLFLFTWEDYYFTLLAIGKRLYKWKLAYFWKIKSATTIFKKSSHKTDRWLWLAYVTMVTTLCWGNLTQQ